MWWRFDALDIAMKTSPSLAMTGVQLAPSMWLQAFNWSDGTVVAQDYVCFLKCQVQKARNIMKFLSEWLDENVISQQYKGTSEAQFAIYLHN